MDTNSGTRGAGPNPASIGPGEICDVLEYGRAQLCCQSYVSATIAREIHVLRLRNAFDKAGIAARLRYAISVLDLMREVQRLKGGYLYPTPLRAISLEETAIVIAPMSTEELKRHLARVERAGYARVLPRSELTDLPCQSLNDWAGFTTLDTRSWAQDLVNKACKEMSATVQPSNVEYYSVRHIPSAAGDRSIPFWSSDARIAAMPRDKVVFCRSRLAQNYYRYFWASVEKGRVVAEAAAPLEINRLQYGISAILGRPITIAFSDRLLRIFAPLPRPERRLLLALGIRTGSSSGKAYEFRSKEHMHVTMASLQRLGCRAREAHAD